MRSDRPIQLDLSVLGFSPQAGGGEAQGGTPRGQADPQARQRFEQALAGSGPGPADPAERGQDAAAQAPPPFALFGSLRGGSSTPPPPPREVPAQIGEMLEQLMVDDGGSGKQVRMELKDDVLPGVTVALQQLDGRLQVDFICRVEASRLRLAAAAPQQAQSLAQRLDRDVLLRVQTDDPDHPCLFEVAAAAGGA